MRSRRAEAFRYLIRYLAQIPSSYRPGQGKHMLLFSSRRSGSTLLRNAFYALPEFNYIDQPLDAWQYNPHFGQLPRRDLWPYASLSDPEWGQLKAYFDDILDRRKVVRSQWQFWREDYHWTWSRYIVKILNGKALMPLFEPSYGDRARIVYSTRHPIPTALSVIRQGWGLTVQAFLEDEPFREQHLSESIAGACRRILIYGTQLERHVLNWCLENLVPLRLWRTKGWLTVSYERLVGHPRYSAERIARFADVDTPDGILATLAIPTRTTLPDSRHMIDQSGPKSRLAAWRSAVNRQDVARIGRIFDLFEIDLYDPEDADPLSEFDQ